jgi:hypothetical protein
VLKLVWNTVARMLHDPIGMILGSAFLLLMLWGPHGNLELLGILWPGWHGPGSDPAARAQIVAGIPWDQEWISFAIGCLLVVVVPILLIKLVYKARLRDFGLGPPEPGRWRLTLLSAGLLFVASLPGFWFATSLASMRSTYPLYRGGFEDVGQFVVYQVGYLLFFVAIEFIFRGYLLFGLYRARDEDALPGTEGLRGPLVFGYYAIFISMLSYTAWHLGKPVPELWGTLVWGIAAGTVVLATRTIWPVVLVHWLLNLIMDARIAFFGS